MLSILLLIGAFFAGCWSLWCLIRILLHAFQTSVLKGFICLLCWFYLVYYAIFEFKHEQKNDILAGWVVGMIVANILRYMA
ncbi:MAG TPA: hypothetical protein VK171_01840 [Fimbriimonas sp.]|nr:hypothetical protein [Fimbriimonas sp.]